jgi:hypothetical protein
MGNQIPPPPATTANNNNTKGEEPDLIDTIALMLLPESLFKVNKENKIINIKNG